MMPSKENVKASKEIHMPESPDKMNVETALLVKFREFCEKTPEAAVLIFLLFPVASVIGGSWLRLTPGMETVYLVYLYVSFFVLALCAVFLVSVLGWRKRSGLSTSVSSCWYLLYLFPGCFSLLSVLVSGLYFFDPLEILLFATLSCLAGFALALFFQGLVFEALSSYGVPAAVVGSGILFGLIHIPQGILMTGSIGLGTAEAFAMMGVGICYAALRVRTGSIWPLVGLHSWNYFWGFMALGISPVISRNLLPVVYASSIIVFLIYAGYGLFLLRKRLRKNSTGVS